MTTYRSKPEDCAPIGWGKIGDVWFTLAPLVDTSTPEGLTASLGCPGDAEKALARWGARLPTAVEIAALGAKGFRIKPVLLPTADMRPLRVPGESDRAYAIRCYAPMQDRSWAVTHNTRCRDQLDAWDRKVPIANYGKHPYRDGPNAPPPGRCYLEGWDGIQKPVPDGTPGPHADGQFDYGTTTIGVVDGAYTPVIGPDLLPQFELACQLFMAGLTRPA